MSVPCRRTEFRVCAVIVFALALGVPVRLQGQPAQDDQSAATLPRFAVSGDASVNLGPDDRQYFNYTDYDHNALRLFSGSLGASFLISRYLTLVGELRLENTDSFRVSALYVRVRPFQNAPVAVQAGRIPPVFGAFSRYRYGSDNPLVSLPLAYQYLTTLRSDAVPPNADALLAVRGEGWLVHYPGPYDEGANIDTSYNHGLALVSTTRWDTGVQVSARGNQFEGTVGVTVGSLSQPRVSDDNDGKQLVGRLVWQPTPAWAFGLSAARGAYLAENAYADPGTTPVNRGPWVQSGLGLDAAFSANYLQVRGELIVTSWRVPVLAEPYLRSPLDATAGTLELRYRLTPAIDLAARADYLALSDVQGTLNGGHPTSWDADVSRLELGGSYRIARGVRAKLVYQHDWRYGDRRVSAGYPVAQLSVWF